MNHARVVEMRSAHEFDLKKEAEAVVEKEKAAAAVEQRKAAFHESLLKSADLTDNLQALTDYLHEHTGATGVYIAKLVAPTRPIEDDADDRAHLDEEAPKVLQYIHATKDHQFMIDRVLTPEVGLTHDVFKETSAGEEPAEEEEAAEGAPPKSTDILDTYKGFVYVPEVVRNQRVHYQKVPRLGCYMAVPLVYQSCLSDEALAQLVEDTQAYNAAVEEQQKEVEAYETELQARREAAEEAKEPFEEEEKEWEEIAKPTPQCTEGKYVVCLDTMGQDCELSAEKKRFVLTTLRAFTKAWEESEQRALLADCERKIEQLRTDPAADAELQQSIAEEVERQIEEAVAQREEPYADDEERELATGAHRLQLQGKLFCEREEWVAYFEDISMYHVLKMPRILQALMYLLGVQREDICEPNSNLFFWKKAKPLFVSKVPTLMCEYQLRGAKPQEFRAFNTLNFIDSLVAGLVQEEVELHHPGIGRIFKWLQTTVATRKQDITRRKALAKRAKEDREAKIAASQERAVNRENYLLEAEERFKAEHAEEIETYEKYMEEQAQKASQEYGEEMDEEDEAKANQEPPVLPVFTPDESAEKFDEETPEIEIPPEVVDDIDNDWVLDEAACDEIIAAYWAARGESS